MNLASLEVLLLNPFDAEVRRLWEPAYEQASCLLQQGAPNALLRRVRKESQSARSGLALLVCATIRGDFEILENADWETVDLTRAQTLPLLAAVRRCHGALAQIHGTSQAIVSAKEATWSACFGADLELAIHLRGFLRRHHVILIGETGTGKEGFAGAVQQGTLGTEDGKGAPAGQLNCAALPETLVESELFGHLRGSFTGADKDRRGALVTADGGSLFLDEFGDLSLAAQAKLLRAIEAQAVRPVGSTEEVPARVRFVCATNIEPTKLLKRKRLRRDLFERLGGSIIRLPPLRARRGDIQALAVAIAKDLIGELSSHPANAVAQELVRRWLQEPAVEAHDWPGNVRELRNAVARVLLQMPPLVEIDAPPARAEKLSIPTSILAGTARRSDMERWYAEHVVRLVRGNKASAARRLGIDTKTLTRMTKGESR